MLLRMPALQMMRDRIRQEARQEGLQKVAINLLKTTDMDIQAISKATGLSEKEVLQIQSKCQ